MREVVTMTNSNRFQHHVCPRNPNPNRYIIRIRTDSYADGTTGVWRVHTRTGMMRIDNGMAVAYCPFCGVNMNDINIV